MAAREAAKAAEELNHRKAQEEKQKAVMEALHKPFDRSADQLMQAVMQLVGHAAERGQSEVEVYRFPNAMCGDRAAGSTTRSPAGKRLWRAASDSRTNSGMITLDHSASNSGLKGSNIRAECPAIWASFSPGRKYM
ncbi:MAG: hypothetical protein JO081_09410 [Alphaproteobacteria bacterium]|nr:hypothetical protein [Alphaproteobacteria bacterium]